MLTVRIFFGVEISLQTVIAIAIVSGLWFESSLHLVAIYIYSLQPIRNASTVEVKKQPEPKKQIV